GMRASRRRWTALSAGVLLAPLLQTSAVVAQTAAPPEADVATRIKAAYIYKFGSYVEWPPSAFDDPASRLRIGVVGDPPVVSALMEVVVGRTVHGREIEVISIASDRDLAGLHIVFLGKGAEALLTAGFLRKSLPT